MQRATTSRRILAIALTVGVMGIVACSTHAGDAGESEQSQSALVTNYENFDSYPVGQWAEGSTHGKWRVVFDGYGTVKVKSTDTAHGQVLNLAPAAPASSSETHAALVVGTESFGDLDVNVSLRTGQQLRTNPNPWEVGWFAWHYGDAGHFYYLILKPNGWELGKRDPAYAGGQRFLATGSSPTFQTGAWHGIRVQQTGNSMTITADGKPLTTFVDQERPYLNGALGLYSEDSIVNFDDITMSSASSTSTTTTTTADAGATTTTDSGTTTTTTTTSPTKMYGVTVDAVDHLSNIVDSLERLPHKPTTRIVFDEYVPATDYTTAATQIQSVSYVMGELLDSFYVQQYSTAAYLARTDEYLSTLGNKVDIWEVGNEINGEWLGDTPTVVAKMTGAYDKVKAAGKTTELTLYYNAGCWEKSDHEMFTWAQANIPQRMKDGLDYVLVSYYEDDCNGRQPDWQSVFTKLGQMFPNSKIGIGECGTTKSASKADYITRYYGMNITAPRYVGGYFWWYFKQDGVPYTNPLFPTFVSAMQ